MSVRFLACAFYLFIRQPHGSEVSPTARNTLDSARIPRASKLLICGLFQKGRVLAQDEESAVALLFGLIASGQIQLRRIDGYQRLSEVLEHAEVTAWYDTPMTEWRAPFFFHGPRDTSSITYQLE